VTSRVTHGCFLAVPVPTSAGTGSRGYGYGWTQIYPWVTRDESYKVLRVVKGWKGDNSSGRVVRDGGDGDGDGK